MARELDEPNGRIARFTPDEGKNDLKRIDRTSFSKQKRKTASNVRFVPAMTSKDGKPVAEPQVSASGSCGYSEALV